jgi:hypothetical protein
MSIAEAQGASAGTSCSLALAYVSAQGFSFRVHSGAVLSGTAILLYVSRERAKN